MTEFDQLADQYDATRCGEQRGEEYAADIDALWRDHFDLDQGATLSRDDDPWPDVAPERRSSPSTTGASRAVR